MIKLSTQTTQTIKFIPRQGVIECLVIENEATSEQVKLDLFEVVDVLGEELVTNGGFDTDSDWILSQSNISNSSLIINFTGSGNIAYQSKSLTSNAFHKVVVNCSSYNSASIELRVGSTSNVGVIDGFGEFVFNIQEQGYSFINFFTQAGFDGTIDNVSVKEVSQDTEIHYTTLDNHTELEINVTEGFLQEGQTYTLKALDSSSNVLFYDKVFCTDQTDYTINKDEFKSYSQSETYKTFKG